MVAAVLYRVFEVGSGIIPEQQRVRVDRTYQYDKYRICELTRLVLQVGAFGWKYAMPCSISYNG